jgi:hypothetical protein
MLDTGSQYSDMGTFERNAQHLDMGNNWEQNAGQRD